MSRRTVFTGLAWLALPLSVLAIEPGPSSPQQQETEQWLNLQPSKQAPSPVAQKAAPTERDLALQRWLKSYEYVIPEHFDQKVGGQAQSK